MDEIIKQPASIRWDTSNEETVVMQIDLGSWSKPSLRFSVPDVDRAIKELTEWKMRRI